MPTNFSRRGLKTLFESKSFLDVTEEGCRKPVQIAMDIPLDKRTRLASRDLEREMSDVQYYTGKLGTRLAEN